ESAGDGGTIAVEDHRYDCVRCCPKRRGPGQELITGKRLVAFIVATRSMLRVGGIPVFESVKARVFSNKLLPVEDAY
ncbi:hypothetical protein, partial [Corynebacterium striatum]|uniref:hypothetical protein n=1 Tax=Corynebacterium striatum TaxID=43770 RepID=UPI0027BA4466